MGDVVTPYWHDVKTAINAVWPEVNAIFRVVQVEKHNWYNLLQHSELGAPWAVAHIPPFTREPGWGAANHAFKPVSTIYYVAKDTGAAIQTALEQKAVLLQDNLLTTVYAFQVLPESLAIDAGDSNPVNKSFAESVMPFSCVSVTFTSLIGFVAGT